MQREKGEDGRRNKQAFAPFRLIEKEEGKKIEEGQERRGEEEEEEEEEKRRRHNSFSRPQQQQKVLPFSLPPSLLFLFSVATCYCRPSLYCLFFFFYIIFIIYDHARAFPALSDALQQYLVAVKSAQDRSKLRNKIHVIDPKHS